MNIITSLIQSSLKLKDQQQQQDEDDISDVSHFFYVICLFTENWQVDSTASTVVNEAAYTEAVDDDMFVAQSFNGSWIKKDMPRILNSEIIHAQLYRPINQIYTRQKYWFIYNHQQQQQHYKNNHQRKKQSQFNTHIHTLFLSTVSPTTTITTFSTRVQPTNHTHLKHTQTGRHSQFTSHHTHQLSNHQINHRLIFRHPQLYYSNSPVC